MLSRLFLLASFLATLSFAQESGAIVGTITDRSAAPVPSAKVVVTETDTGVSRTATTDAQGGYVVPLLRATRYNFSAEAAGFKGFVRNDVTLQANQSLTIPGNGWRVTLVPFTTVVYGL
jgi:hypothetical protein